MRIFWSLGYEATSMADLRAALGITQASLDAAFGSKEQLFREAVDLYYRTTGLTTARALAFDSSAREAIHAMLKDAVGQREGDVPKAAPIVVLAAYCATVLHGLALQSRDSPRRLLSHPGSHQLYSGEQSRAGSSVVHTSPDVAIYPGASETRGGQLVSRSLSSR
jgi:AcrR family transcriptional regulator